MSKDISIRTFELEGFADLEVKSYIELHQWMKDKKFLLLTKKEDIEKFVNKAIEKKICAVDLETTGKNTRLNPTTGKCYSKIVGVSLSHDINEGAYIPIDHIDSSEYNVSLNFVIEQLKRLQDNCVLVFHNFKFDGELLRYYGIIIENENKYEDTYLMCAIEDSSRKRKGLKYLSKELLDRPQIEYEEINKNVNNFSEVPPKKAVYYAGADAMNTLALYYHFKDSLDKQDPDKKNGPWFIYKIEKRCLFVTMEMERNTVLVDKDYLSILTKEVTSKIKELEKKIYDIVGEKFDINSSQQLGKILFEKLKLPYPKGDKRTKSGDYITEGEVLEKLKEEKNPEICSIIADLILGYRSLLKTKSTYLDNFSKNIDTNGFIRFNLNQVQTDTGRYSSTGGEGIDIDGYCGINCQNIPVYNKNDPYSVNLRRILIARQGYKIVSIDYSGEELRIAANLSGEEKWIDEFINGSGDLHTITGKIITGKKEITKEERKIAKTLNFLTLYGGGPSSFSIQAKIPLEKAKEIMAVFFKEYKGLSHWIKRECLRAKERMYSKTALGRRRPLDFFYKSNDKIIQARGDRCAINSAVQGTGADIIKIALWRVYNWIKDNRLQDDVKILMPIHDEIVYEIKEDKLDIIIPELCEIMKLKDVCSILKWKVPLEVDAEYGDSFDVDRNFWEEYKKNNDQQIENPNETPSQLSPNQDNPIIETPKDDYTKENISIYNSKIIDIVLNLLSIIKNKQLNKETLNLIESLYLIPTKEHIKKELEKEKINKIENYKKSIIKDINKKDYYEFVISLDVLTAYKVTFIFDFINSINNTLINSNKKKIYIIAKGTGEILYKTTKEYSIDAFLTLCFLFNIG